MYSLSASTFVLSVLSFSLLTHVPLCPRLIGGSTLYLGKDTNKFLTFFFYHVVVTLPLAHLPFKAHDSHFNQEHKMFELQMLMERLTVLLDNSRNHQFKTKLGAKLFSRKVKQNTCQAMILWIFPSFMLI